jgi:uncharacterized protein
MKKIISCLVLFMLCCFHVSVSASEYSGKTEQITLSSKVLSEDRELIVYLPAGYDSTDDKFAVLYITDGQIQGQHTAGSVDFLSKFDQIPKLIVVGIVNPGNSRTKDLTLAPQDNPQADLAGADRFLSFIETEVIPLIKSRYRTLDYQALSGTSHGGQFALNALLKRPELFDGIVAISPSLYWNNNQLLGLAEEALKKQALKGRLFISIADEVQDMTVPFAKLAELTKQYPNAALDVAIKTFADESHDSTTLLGQYYGIKHLFPNWAIPNRQQTLADLQAVFSARSKVLGITLPIPQDRANGYGQWLQYSNRQDEAIEMFQWNRKTYAQSFAAHKALISAYLYFKLTDEAKAALAEALKTLKALSPEQKQQLEDLIA